MELQKIKKVLIALDYDPTAQTVAETGFSLARAMDAETVLLHIISDPVIYTSPGHVTIMGFANYMDTNIDTTQFDTADGLKKASRYFLDQTRQYLGDDKIQTMVEEGDFAETILNTATAIHADIIIMGSHSMKWLEQAVIGSVTEKVLRQTSIPLFIVPTKKTIKGDQ
jgi:nucleotide-binding universal stress UspA family protein